jgi:hypothetical protein
VVIADGGQGWDLLAKALDGTGVKLCETSKLLGVGLATKYNGGRQVIRTRFSKAAARRRRFRPLLAAGAKTWRVSAAGTNKARMWGSSILGVSDGELRKARACTAREVSGATRGGSVTAKLALWPTKRGEDPAYEANAGPIQAWAEGWFDAGEPTAAAIPTRSMLKRSFLRAVHRQTASAQPWRHVRGPAAAVVATLRRIEWQIVAPSVWVTDRGELVDLDELSPRYVRQMTDDATERWLAKEWAREAGDPTLRAGVWTKPLLAAIARAPRGGATYLRRVASQTEWAQARLFTARRAESPL